MHYIRSIEQVKFVYIEFVSRKKIEMQDWRPGAINFITNTDAHESITNGFTEV